MAKKKMTIFVLTYQGLPEIGVIAKSRSEAINRIEKEKLLNDDISATIRRELKTGEYDLHTIDVY